MPPHRKNRFQKCLKRAFDFSLSSLLLVVLFPLFVVLFRWIRKGSAGPAIFKQERVGKGGKTFTMYKFRTMYVESPPYAIKPQEDYDPRITEAGRFLRATGLDELPQLLNVLKGEMSLVGPRPEMPFIVAGYNEYQRRRLEAKPGLTGLWQISLDRHRPIHENVGYDIAYIEDQTFLEDIGILWKTFLFLQGQLWNWGMRRLERKEEAVEGKILNQRQEKHVARNE